MLYSNMACNDLSPEEYELLLNKAPVAMFILDDSGYWDSVETYIERHLETQFRHSLCPDWGRELYGKHDWFKDSEKS